MIFWHDKKQKKRILLAAAVLMSTALQAQDHLYIDSGAQFYTHPGANFAIFGDLINDAEGGLNHFNGGTIYIHRDSTNIGQGSSRIYDGPKSQAPTDFYNGSGAYVRVYDLVTDNSLQNAVASGGQVNADSGAGDVQIEQELRVSGKHIFKNGMIWTPRTQWKHAYLHYENGASYSGESANNVAGVHVDGYVAYSGASDFTFPIGDGISPREAGIVAPDSGIYKAAYYPQNAKNGTWGLSGSNAHETPLNDGLTQIASSEFWDVDGTADTRIYLTSLNSGRKTSDWNSDFGSTPLGANASMTIAGWDDWENLSIDIQPSGYSVDGKFTTTKAITPDLPGTAGAPYSAFTWGILGINSNAADNLRLYANVYECNAHLRFQTSDEKNTRYAEVYRSNSGSAFAKIGEFNLNQNTTGKTNYIYEDTTVLEGRSYKYRIDVIDANGAVARTAEIPLTINCSANFDWELYPNPSSDGRVTVESNYDQPIYGYRVISEWGQILREILIPEPTAEYLYQQIDMGVYAKGVYYLSLLDKDLLTIHTFKVHIRE